MRKPFGIAVLTLAAVASGPARARESTLVPFAPERLAALAPLLRQGEMAAIETDGLRPRQVTLLGYTVAPPEIAHAVVGHPEDYPRFVRNVSKSTVEQRPDGSLRNAWRLELPIGHFGGENDLRFLAPPETGPIAVRGVGRETQARWEFLPAAGGGTVIVEYMDYEVPRDNVLLARMLEKNPAFETGMQLAAGLVVLKSVLGEAERKAREAHREGVEPPASGGGFGFLLERGAVAVIRSTPSGALKDVSVVQRITAPPAALLELIRTPERWPEFFPSVLSCKVRERSASGLTFDDTIEGFILNVETRYRMEFQPSAVDVLGLSGDLRGARFRWDFTPAPSGRYTTAIYRANFNLREAGALVRVLLRYEPFFEHGVNVGVGITAMQAVARRAATLAAPTAATSPPVPR